MRLPEKITLKVEGYENPHSDVKLPLLEKDGSFYILLNYEAKTSKLCWKLLLLFCDLLLLLRRCLN